MDIGPDGLNEDLRMKLNELQGDLKHFGICLDMT
jgi:hypothetical protein